jgi:hypothetical protein
MKVKIVFSTEAETNLRAHKHLYKSLLLGIKFKYKNIYTITHHCHGDWINTSLLKSLTFHMIGNQNFITSASSIHYLAGLAFSFRRAKDLCYAITSLHLHYPRKERSVLLEGMCSHSSP